MGLISFLVCYILFILHISGNISSFVLHIPPKRYNANDFIYNQVCCQAFCCILFICVPASGNGFISERLRISLEIKRGSVDLNWRDMNKVINGIKKGTLLRSQNTGHSKNNLKPLL